MTQFYIFIFVTTLFMSMNVHAHNQYSLLHNSEDYSQFSNYYPYDFEANCTKSGLLCKTCSQLINCIQIGPGNFMEVHVKTCAGETAEGNHEYCLINKCSTEPNPKCRKEGASQFQCHNTGVFPDPTDCRLYHMCVEKQHNLEPTPTPTPTPTPITTPTTTEPTTTHTTTVAPPTTTPNPTPGDDEPIHIGVKCLDDYGYNPITTYCDKKLANGVCSGTPVPVCKELGQAGAIPGTSIFYVCMEDDNGNIVANLFMCPHGTRFVNGGCGNSFLMYHLNDKYQIVDRIV